ncbi:methylaspartate ammonia-lyase [Carboxydocella sporoproducens DSM 16521]|uniref:methylaspartate ammonia-lyase n=2 Tax=Carboxydocella TaxID=178898 RepID=A0A1T4LF54_9FIRM|nr:MULTISPECIES: methylaspartate ammonia-lyase [Carboxydocella]AVX19818.1 methylaspartate ammonia-lyase [Carboxydocella thermautotrophica]AVX30227.1 methylaspartate ammonia-lyase [Carboxydocella thermautotrophica]SJZ53251.1 methylaspartate ammonia-lyase [Carboxydocella sporoproducens DSM 16521]
MKIIDVVFSAGLTGFFFDDQKAIKAGAQPDGGTYRGQPLTPGFSAVRQRGESISIMLMLEDGQIAFGDCAAVQYSGAGGRDPLFLARDFIPLLEEEVKPRLLGRELTAFRPLAQEFDHFIRPNGERLHTALRYGITQALLDAVARAHRETMAETIAREYGTQLVNAPVPIFCQTGDERHNNADKAIVKRADVLPHGLINNVETKLGKNGELLLEYVEWLRKRVEELGQPGYRPVLHIDVYGTIGLAFGHDTKRMAAYLKELEAAARPLQLRIEGPMDMGNKPDQMRALKDLKQELTDTGCTVEIVADEWCNTLEDIIEFTDHQSAHMVQIKTPDLGGINNTIEAVLYAKARGMGAYLGGTCNETDRSAQVCVHIALATNPDQMLAKPGMGVDEGLMVVYNEMARTLAILKMKGKI